MYRGQSFGLNKSDASTARGANAVTRIRTGFWFGGSAASFLLLLAFLPLQRMTTPALAQEKGTDSRPGRPPEIQVVQTKEVTVVTLAGVGPQDQGGRLVAPGDFVGQFKQTWENMRRLLATAGTPVRSIVSLTVYTTDAKWQEVFTALQQENFSGWSPATSFAVAQPQQLRTPGSLLELQAVAVIEKRKPLRR